MPQGIWNKIDKIKLCEKCHYIFKVNQSHQLFCSKKCQLSRKMKRWNKNLKDEIFQHYSDSLPKCKKCGYNNIMCLDIDHINNKGGEQRKKLNLHSGQQFYQWLKKNNFPKGYQVLCKNCNWLKWREVCSER